MVRRIKVPKRGAKDKLGDCVAESGRLSCLAEKAIDSVNLVVTRTLGKGQRLWEADSIVRRTAKQLINCLKEVGLIHSDGPTWIRHCDYRQYDGDRTLGPAVRIDFMSVDIVSTSTTGS